VQRDNKCVAQDMKCRFNRHFLNRVGEQLLVAKQSTNSCMRKHDVNLVINYASQSIMKEFDKKANVTVFPITQIFCFNKLDGKILLRKNHEKSKSSSVFPCPRVE
jgi:hypothetical protein